MVEDAFADDADEVDDGLLVTYQALRVAITDATLGCPDVDPDRASFTIALNAARDQLIHAAGVIETMVTASVHDRWIEAIPPAVGGPGARCSTRHTVERQARQTTVPTR
ncbi:hypothetical protein OPAG_06760 [Rhodococcus opacus PD630]|uniref:hypothetical protein n=1 Tax=Rhodococcus opacus TaxID=37919 RepID=UPI00029CD3FA|nr:hypothetical protein [Rhodococcus opacus]AHK35926.1 hypothetical protein Pd630_LPD15016 [Rhodococcus opacus PD630]EHI43482.1 hypothetical protein OPAG_06760 [Rhodococcus opacus PD630]UDH01574.1 hypothetical protein K2Z90_007853 [Rhodococcus opacus PD630]